LVNNNNVVVLQDPKLKTRIVCDDKLKAVMKKKKVDQREMLALMNAHLSDI
jgi:chromatin remodeling complex protein RSC6